jgi:hypothetical protein
MVGMVGVKKMSLWNIIALGLRARYTLGTYKNKGIYKISYPGLDFGPGQEA